MTKLTGKQAFCLRCLNLWPSGTSIDISRAAQKAGLNRSGASQDEWADVPLRELVKRGLIEWTGEKKDRRKIFKITLTGIDALVKHQAQIE